MKKVSEFEKKVRIGLIKKGMTVTSLAEELGVSVSYVYELMKGTRKNEDQLAKIRNILDIDDDE